MVLAASMFDEIILVGLIPKQSCWLLGLDLLMMIWLHWN